MRPLGAVAADKRIFDPSLIVDIVGELALVSRLCRVRQPLMFHVKQNWDESRKWYGNFCCIFATPIASESFSIRCPVWVAAVR